MDRPVQPKPKLVRSPVTALRLDREKVKAAKYRALDEGRTLTEVINRAIDHYLRTTRP